VLGCTGSEIESSQGSLAFATPTKNLARHFAVTLQWLEGSLDLRQSVIRRIAEDHDRGEIFLLNTLGWFWDQWENGFIAGVCQSLWEQKLSWLNEIKINDLWFDVKMHCAKNYRPFELFVNENH